MSLKWEEEEGEGRVQGNGIQNPIGKTYPI